MPSVFVKTLPHRYFKRLLFSFIRFFSFLLPLPLRSLYYLRWSYTTIVVYTRLFVQPKKKAKKNCQWNNNICICTYTISIDCSNSSENRSQSSAAGLPYFISGSFFRCLQFSCSLVCTKVFLNYLNKLLDLAANCVDFYFIFCCSHLLYFCDTFS